MIKPLLYKVEFLIIFFGLFVKYGTEIKNGRHVNALYTYLNSANTGVATIIVNHIPKTGTNKYKYLFLFLFTVI